MRLEAYLAEFGAGAFAPSGVFAAATALAFAGVIGLSWVVRRYSLVNRSALRNGQSRWLSPAVALVALSATLAAAGATVYHLGKRSVTHATHERLGAVARLKAQQIEQWLEENSEHLQLSLSRPAPPQADLHAPGTEEESMHALEDQLKHLEARSAFDGFALRDGRDGNVLLSVGEFDDGAEARLHAAEAATSQRSALLQLRRGPRAQRLSMFVPLPAEQGRPWTAVVQASIDLRRALAPLIERWQGTDATAQTLLVKPDERRLDVLLRSGNAATDPATAAAASFAAALAPLMNAGGPVATDDDRGVPVLAYATPVRGTPWMLVAKVDLSEACAALDSLAVLSAGLGVLLLMGCAWWWVEHHRDLARRIQHHVERAELGDRVLALSRRVVQVQEEERKRISVDLHDSAGANLAAVQLHLAAIEKHLRAAPAQAHDLLHETHALVNDTILGIREACGELRPAVLDRMGLVPALKSYALDFARRTGVDVRFDADPFDKPVPADQASALYRIAQEALHNCAAHAGARRIDIALRAVGQGLRFSITDDGTGFDPSALRGHDGQRGLGLVSMRERAELFGGRLSLDTRPGHGTRVVVEMPRPGLAVTAAADGA